MSAPRSKTKYTAALIAVSAMYAALMVGGKELFAVLPNVEVVTLLAALCAYVWGPLVVYPAVNVFVAVDMAIWGVNTWIISYFVHWNVVATCFWLLGKIPHKNKYVEASVAAIAGVVLSVLFGVLTSFVDTVVGYTGAGWYAQWSDLLPRFAVIYTAGAAFYITQAVCNAVLFATAFLPLVRVNRNARLRLSPDTPPTADNPAADPAEQDK